MRDCQKLPFVKRMMEVIPRQNMCRLNNEQSYSRDRPERANGNILFKKHHKTSVTVILRDFSEDLWIFEGFTITLFFCVLKNTRYSPTVCKVLSTFSVYLWCTHKIYVFEILCQIWRCLTRKQSTHTLGLGCVTDNDVSICFYVTHPSPVSRAACKCSSDVTLLLSHV